MLCLFIPSSVRKFYFLFKDIFVILGFSYDESCAVILYFLMGAESFCDLVRRCPWSYSVSTLCRAAKKFDSNRFIRRNQNRILKKLATRNHGDFCFAIDDTANPKYGSAVYGSAPFHSSSGSYFGQKVLVLVIVDLKSHQAFPISYAFLTGKKDPDHVAGHHRAIDLIQEAIHQGFPPMPVTSDSWFDSKEFIQAVKNLGCEFAGELKSSRLARDNSNPGTPRKKLGLWFKPLERVRLVQTKFQKRKEKRGKVFSAKTLFIKDLNIPLTVIAVYNRINGSAPFAFYATTDSLMTGARLWRFSRARWAIEVLFRNLKQSLAFGSLTAGGEGGAHMAVCLPLILLTSIQLDSKEVWDSKEKETLGTTVKKLQERELMKTLEAIISQPLSTRFEKLRARRKNPNQKPTNLSGEKKAA